MDLFVFKCFYLMLPAYFANMAPVIFQHVFKKLAIPLDFGKKLNDKRLFGKNKTFRGLIVGTLSGILIAYLQYALHSSGIITVGFTDLSNWLSLGFLMGFGAILGDLIESFFKRQFDIKPGQSFRPWDQIDFALGAMLLSSLVFLYSFLQVITILLLTFILHIIVNHTAYFLHIRKEKW
ncbi:MAG: CDP-2,3-bis-(O-geranylgeranyl)-sn-glycerol synthase [Nanoarchaeota archaeon]|nr:CDP-2,3-bis-(O-geranylgeranyl)-sn-glycerol synthase [Nanoarchaeota archaeon]MBU1703971.1 CDP-2,3-bis-(O-geranylgeranyl)-sn-glycerol synthase [Nanoarchaeota archaeon]